MIPIKRRLLYIFRGTLLRLRITWGGGSITLSVGYHVDRTDSKGRPKWDGQRCVRGTTHGKDKVPAATINTVLANLEEQIDEAFKKYEILDKTPTAEQIKAKLKGEEQPVFGVFEAFDEFISEGELITQWSKSTLKQMRTMKRLLMLFNSKLTFEDINIEFMKQFMAFQTQNSVSGVSEKEIMRGKAIVHYSGKYQNDTINKNMRNVKWFIRWAASKGYTDGKGVIDFSQRYKSVKKPVIYLTWDELMRVYELDLSKRPELDLTRDMFCFCCFTSLRYSDMINLKWANVTDTHINIVTKKTADALTIDLNKRAKVILEKYRTEESEDTDNVFRTKSPQKVNLRLKEICKMCGIDTPIIITQMHGSKRTEIVVPKYELVSTHCGRRTFISNALAMGIPPNVVMKWTGHSDYAAMLPYIEIADRVKAENMHKFDD